MRISEEGGFSSRVEGGEWKEEGASEEEWSDGSSATSSRSRRGRVG